VLAQAEDPGWPQWRGPQRDGHSPLNNVADEWPKAGPPVAWHVDNVGAGYASVAVRDGRLYTQGDVDGVEQVLCLDANTGERIWIAQAEPVAQALAEKVGTEFSKVDTSGDGRIDELEALTRFGWDWNKFNRPGQQDLSQQRAEKVFAHLDKNGDERLSFDEAGEGLRDAFDRADRTDDSADAQKLADMRTTEFLKLDKDGDEQISKQEAERTWLGRQFGRIDEPLAPEQPGDELLTKEEIKKSLIKHEPGRDGFVTQNELLTFYQESKATGDDELSRDELRSALGGYRSGMGDGPRGTPAIDGDQVYVLGALGDLSCLDTLMGSTVWHVNLVKDFEGTMPGAGYCESPLIASDLLIVSPGGKHGTLLALDKLTGKKVWQSREITEQPDYASPVVATIGGIEQVVQFSHESVFGVRLTDGKLLWRYTAPASKNANCCTPIVAGDLVFAASGYGNGGGLARIVSDGNGGQTAEEVYFQKKMTCHYGGAVKVGGFLYSNADGPLICMEYETGDVCWQSRSVGKGSLVAVGDLLILVSEGHEIALVEADPDRYRERGRFKSPRTKASVLAHPAIAHGKLFVREQERLTAYDLTGNASKSPRVADRAAKPIRR
jgi:outer membrane protein assembly factor BamB